MFRKPLHLIAVLLTALGVAPPLRAADPLPPEGTAPIAPEMQPLTRCIAVLLLMSIVGCQATVDPSQSPAPTSAIVADASSPAAALDLTLEGPGGEAALFSGDGSRLLLADDRKAQVWDTAMWKRVGPVIALNGYAQFELDEKGKRLLITQRHIELDQSGRPGYSELGESFVWDVDAGKRLSPVLRHKDYGSYRGRGMALSPDGKLVARIGDGPAPRVGARQPVHLLHADTLEEFRKIADPMPLESPDAESSRDRAIVRESSYFAEFNPEHVMSVSFQRDGSLVVIGTLDSVHKWDVESGKVRMARECPYDTVETVTDNDRVLLNRIGGFLVYELVTGKELVEDTYYKYDFVGMQISDDGAIVGVTLNAEDWGTRVWDVNTGKKLALLPEFVVLHPRGGMVAASTHDTAGVWDVVTGKCIRKPKTKGYYSIAVFSPDGTRLALTGEEGTVVLLARPGVTGARAWDEVNDAEAKK